MDPFLMVAIAGVVILGITFAIPAIKKLIDKNNGGETTPVVMKGPAGDAIGSLAAKLKTWLSGLGIVEDVNRIQGEVELIAAFAFVVMLRPRVLKVINPEQRPRGEALFAELLSLVGSEKPAPPAPTA